MTIATLGGFMSALAPRAGCYGRKRPPSRARTLSKAARLLKYAMAFAFLVCLLSDSYAQLRPFPEKSGFSGYVNLGAGALRGKSNVIAGTRFGASISKETIPSIDAKPDAETTGVPLVNFELNYTFATKRTQVFLGNLLEDFLRFDFATQLGVRHQFRDKSIFAASLLSTSIPAEVWADPYVENQKRDETDRTSNGIRLIFGRIAGTGLQLEYTQRKIEIDDELSGLTQLGLSAQQAALLDREGDLQRLRVTYYFKLNERNSIAPALWFTNEDLDGGAMANDLIEIYFTHLYNGKRFNFVTNVAFGTADYDKVNPIYGRKRDDDRTVLSFTVFDKKLFGENAKWWGSLTVAAFSEDANIDFYDQDMAVFGLSAFRLF